ncbi:MAG TPA: long-chain fatty acid--CoA ligase [Polyangiaceae bacterium]|nr:long-chain fatty acid--CoA ligase [Polyangiaceae bacterium]
MPYASRYSDLVSLLESGVTKYGNKPLFGTRRGGVWHWTTFAEFSRLADDCRGGLSSLGVGPGDRVAVISNNRLEWVVAAHGTYGLSAAYTAMYETQLEKEWQYILNDSGAKVCFAANRAIAEKVLGFRSECPELRHVVVFDGKVEGALDYAELLARGRENPAPKVKPSASDVACFIYTSGTTGNPKGVRLTHGNLASNVSGIIDVSPIRDAECSLAFLPWAHVYGGCVEVHTAIAMGNSIAICDDTSKLVDYLPEVRPTLLFAVPRIWNRIYDGVQKQIAAKPKLIQQIFSKGMSGKSKLKRGEPLTLAERISVPLAEKLVFSKVVQRFGGRLSFAFSGAAALSRDVAEFIDNLGIEVYEGYGMTESSGCTTSNRPDSRRIGSVGKPIPGVEVKLDYSAPGAGEGEGEILIYGTGVMAGYHHLEDVTRDTLTPDGGLRSGDLGRFDADGFLYVTGRVKELFKLSNGKYVAPAPLEEKIQLSSFVSQCVVYGEDRPHNVALIVPDADSLTAWARSNGVGATVRDAIRDPRVKALYADEIAKLSSDFKGYERIKDFFFEVDPLTTENGMLTPTLKLKRRNVVKRYGPQFDALYG